MTVLEEKMRKDKGSQRQTKRIVGHKSTRETEVTGVKGDPERSSVGTMEKEKGIREGMKRQSVGGKKKKNRGKSSPQDTVGHFLKENVL